MTPPDPDLQENMKARKAILLWYLYLRKSPRLCGPVSLVI